VADLSQPFYFRFPAECTSEIILEIGQYVAKIRTSVWCRYLTFCLILHAKQTLWWL